MARLFVCDNGGYLSIDIEASGPVLGAALEDRQAESVVRCALLMALSALVEGGGWPAAALETLAGFMESMKDEIQTTQMM